MPDLSMQELERQLVELPSEKALASERYERQLEEWKLLKNQVKLIRARSFLTIRARTAGTRTNQSEINAAVENDSDVIEAEQLLVRKEAIVRRLDVEVTKHDDMFTGAKMVCRIRIAEMGGGLSHEASRRRMPINNNE